MKQTELQHIHADKDDLNGNDGIGRYFFLTGSDGRAQQISERFNDTRVLIHPRQHNIYLGTISSTENDKNSKPIDVAAISTGIGGSSADIIINELIILGAKRLLRVGTAGSMQPERILVGDVVIATAAVRDDKASWDYIYKEYPAVASLEYIIAAKRAALSVSSKKTGMHFGIVHSKSSLYAREFLMSLLEENQEYQTVMHKAGVLATEMECAQLFILSTLLSENKDLKKINPAPILCGAILAIVGSNLPFSSNKKQIANAIQAALSLSFETVRQLALIDQKETFLF